MSRFPLVGVLAVLIWPGWIAASAQDEIENWGKTTDPDGNCAFQAEGNKLSIEVPGPAHDLSGAELNRMNAPRVLTKMRGDFVIVVRVLGDFTPGEATIPERTAYNGAGLLIMADNKTYLRLERATLARGGTKQHYANFELRKDGQVERIGTPSDFVIDPAKVTYLRIERRGNTVLGSVTQDPGTWTKLNPKAVDLPDELQIGVAAINASTTPFTARFESLSILQRPHSAEATPAEKEKR